MTSITTLIAGCAVCAANDTDYGWFILASTVLLSATALAGLVAWKDARARGPLPMQVDG